MDAYKNESLCQQVANKETGLGFIGLVKGAQSGAEQRAKEAEENVGRNPRDR